MSLRYRAEIDGLRTIAVGAVLIYHATVSIGGNKVLNGGFLGVDIFFVISGFLITSLILHEWSETGRFSILNFYERRARRLLPALFVVIFATLPAAWFILYPSQMVDLVKSLLASIFFVSNMFWHFSLQEYGAASGLLQPFLHTWSLAVEEQFYIFFPLIYVAFLKRSSWRAIFIGGVAVIVLGLVASEMLTKWDRGLSFYWLISRIWELMAGSVLAHLLFHRPDWKQGQGWRLALPGIGFAMVLISMWRMDLGWHHPGAGTVAAVLGTVLIIWFAAPQEPVTRLLSSKFFVGIGLISYSLYLWHYPIFAFGRMLSSDPNLAEKAIWFALSFGLATASYYLVETPFRQRTIVSIRGLVSSMLGATVLVCVFCVAMLSLDGMKARFPGLTALYGQNEFDNSVLQDLSWQPLADLAATKGLARSKAHDPSEFEAEHLWFDQDSPAHKLLLVGNSHSKDMFNAFHLNPDLFDDLQVARFAMRANLNAPSVARLLASPNFETADTIALAFRYTPRTLERLPGLIDDIQALNKKILLILNTVEFQLIDGRPVFDWYVQDAKDDFSDTE